MKILYPVLLCLVLLTAGCTVATEITLTDSDSGRAVSRVSMSPLLRRYLSDLAEVQGVEVTEKSSFFDTPALAAGIGGSPGLDLVGLVQESPAVLQLLLSFKDIEKMFPRESTGGGDPVITRTSRGGSEIINIRITRENVAGVMQIIPMGSDPVSQTITGIFEAGGAEAELTEMLSWVFEEYAPPEEVRKMIQTAAVDLTVSVPGTITSVQGGSSTSPGTASFSIPLIRFFSLNPPIEYRIIYTP